MQGVPEQLRLPERRARRRLRRDGLQLNGSAGSRVWAARAATARAGRATRARRRRLRANFCNGRGTVAGNQVVAAAAARAAGWTGDCETNIDDCASRIVVATAHATISWTTTAARAMRVSRVTTARRLQFPARHERRVRITSEIRTQNDATAPAASCNTDNGSFCAHDHVPAAPHIPDQGRAVYTYTYDMPVSIEDIHGSSANGINRLRVELDNSTARARVARAATRMAPAGTARTKS